ncbi:MAG TPA: ABC transporter permease [Baekduia sp.]|nr:ABC transporter permease [Baekduia sp.]
MNLANVIRAEWIKLASVRSTWWTLAACYVITVGIAAAALFGIQSSNEVPGRDFFPVDVALVGLMFGQLAMAVTGVLVISSEYSSGGMRTTLTAVPARLRLLAAKAIVLGAYSLAVGALIVVSCFVLMQITFGGQVGADLSDDGVLRALAGGALYLSASALLAFGVGAIVRNTGGGITATVALLFVLPLMAFAPPGWMRDTGADYFTTNAGQQIIALDQGDGLGPWLGFVVYLVWVAVGLTIAAVALRRRDA